MADEHTSRQSDDLPEWFRQLGDGTRQRGADATAGGGRFDPNSLEAPGRAENSVPDGGEIVVVRRGRDDAAGPDARYGLVRYVDEQGGYASVALISLEVDSAGGTDVILPPERTSLPFEVMVETDVVAPVWFEQLSGPVRAVDEATLEGVLATEFDGKPSVPHAWRGLPLSGPDDRRWKFKLDEAKHLMALASSCVASMVDGTRGGGGQPDAQSSEVDSPEKVAAALWEQLRDGLGVLIQAAFAEEKFGDGARGDNVRTAGSFSGGCARRRQSQTPRDRVRIPAAEAWGMIGASLPDTVTVAFKEIWVGAEQKWALEAVVWLPRALELGESAHLVLAWDAPSGARRLPFELRPRPEYDGEEPHAGMFAYGTSELRARPPARPSSREPSSSAASRASAFFSSSTDLSIPPAASAAQARRSMRFLVAVRLCAYRVTAPREIAQTHDSEGHSYHGRLRRRAATRLHAQTRLPSERRVDSCLVLAASHGDVRDVVRAHRVQADQTGRDVVRVNRRARNRTAGKASMNTHRRQLDAGRADANLECRACLRESPDRIGKALEVLKRGHFSHEECHMGYRALICGESNLVETDCHDALVHARHCLRQRSIQAQTDVQTSGETRVENRGACTCFNPSEPTARGCGSRILPLNHQRSSRRDPSPHDHEPRPAVGVGGRVVPGGAVAVPLDAVEEGALRRRQGGHPGRPRRRRRGRTPPRGRRWRRHPRSAA